MTQTIDLINPQQAHVAIKTLLWPQAKALLMAGHQLKVEVRLAEDVKTDKQRRFYHGFILKTIAERAVVNGQRFDLKTWKEFLRDRFLGSQTKTFRNPITGKKTRRRLRVSSEDLGVKGYHDLIEKVTAFACTELGVEFPSEWVDPDSGEVYRT